VVVHGLQDPQAIAAMAAALGSPYEVSGAAHLPGSIERVPKTLLRLEGFRQSVDYRAGELRRVLAPHGPTDTMPGETAAPLWTAIRDGGFLAEPRADAVWRVSVAASRAPAVMTRLPEGLVRRHLFDWGGGLVWLSTAASGDAGAAALRTALPASEKILRTCVHCGFCTATCPTFLLLGDELDSRAAASTSSRTCWRTAARPTLGGDAHVDRCLSCLSCMTTCPSGVTTCTWSTTRALHRGDLRPPVARPDAARRARGDHARTRPFPPGADGAPRSARPLPALRRRLPVVGAAPAAMLALAPVAAARRTRARAAAPAPRASGAAAWPADRLRAGGARPVDQRGHHPPARRAPASRWCRPRARAAAARSSTTWASRTRHGRRPAPISTPGRPRSRGRGLDADRHHRLGLRHHDQGLRLHVPRGAGLCGEGGTRLALAKDITEVLAEIRLCADAGAARR
jgi:ferredoxin